MLINNLLFANPLVREPVARDLVQAIMPAQSSHLPSLESFRDDFPILHQEANGCPLVYFDNAATTQ